MIIITGAMDCKVHFLIGKTLGEVGFQVLWYFIGTPPIGLDG